MNRPHYDRSVHIQVLGPLRVLQDGENLPLGGPQRRLVLALLIAAGGRTVPMDDLIEGVWGEDPPTSARGTIQGYVHHLRAQVGHRLTTEARGRRTPTSAPAPHRAVDFEGTRSPSSHADRLKQPATKRDGQSALGIVGEELVEDRHHVDDRLLERFGVEADRHTSLDARCLC